MNKKSRLGQFYTPFEIAEEMVLQCLKLNVHPKKVIELAAGEGHLLAAMEKYRKNSAITAVDIDVSNTEFLKAKNTNWNVFTSNATEELTCLDKGEFDLALGNPPFLKKIAVTEYLADLFMDILGLHFDASEKTRAEYIFICQYLSLLTEGGVLAVIVPDSIISGEQSLKFREALFNRYTVIAIEEVSGKSFNETEAKTHIVYIVNKIRKKARNIEVRKIFSNSKSINLTLEQAINRADYSYYNVSSAVFSKSYSKLGEASLITRGKYTHKYLKKNFKHYIHSTTFMTDFASRVDVCDNQNLLMDGDVIMCRVGTRVVGKVREYKGSPVPFSDCIYRIRFFCNETKNQFLAYSSTEIGNNEIASISKGVCSRYITKKDLCNLNFS